MSNLKDIKQRIKSIQNTKKITQAMKMVAAAKVKKAENAVKSARPYSQNIRNAFAKVLKSSPSFDTSSMKFAHSIENYPELMKHREINTVGILLITSDKGLAGAYNANLVRRTTQRIKELKSEGKDVKLFIVGQKGFVAMKRVVEQENVEILGTYTKLPPLITVSNANVIAEDIAHSYVEAQIDKIEIITTRFKSMLSFIVENWDILPVLAVEEEKKHELEPEMMFEPSSEEVLKKIVPMYVSNSVYQALLEASASELASRMAAMSNASTNADDMIRSLTVDYNKARQAAITQEISEVVSGADALKS